MIRRPPRSTRTDTLFPYTTLFRSYSDATENRNTTDTGSFSLDFPTIEDYPTVRALGVPTHRFIMAASVDLPWDFALSGKFLYQSPQPPRALVSTPQPFERDVATGVAKGNGARWGRPEERGVGEECVSTCKTRGGRY